MGRMGISETQEDLCLLRRAIRALIRQKPRGLTRSEIGRLLREDHFPGTYRNLLFLSSSILESLVKEGKVARRGEGPGARYVPLGK